MRWHAQLFHRELFCQWCGKEVQQGASFCSNCGKSLSQLPVSSPTPYRPYAYPGPVAYSKRKDEGIAAVLSFLFTGLGQVYNGQIGKGIVFIVLGIFFAFSILVLVGT